jgi:hypothetical protein
MAGENLAGHSTGVGTETSRAIGQVKSDLTPEFRRELPKLSDDKAQRILDVRRKMP